jgi:hypothetical protein
VNKGLELTVTDPDGVSFKCRYAAEDFNTAMGAVRNLISRQKRHYILAIEPCEEPPPPMSIDQWIAAGHTTD